ncbi:glycosyl transferase [Virgisporangium aliadipatigenens]|uniref:Glycosyl transferase n=1 Tax=Virgisporangium aliadipatigenens TaxID=741659 RepID=A0A8J3YS06_9ACTN|nr:glycosyl transferase [Virgisporangium aliadipatigenens]
MRVLFVGLGSVGHTYPMVPLARAARAAGHEVHFAVGEAVHPELAAEGLRPFRPADAFYGIYAEDLAPELERLRPDLVVHGWGVPDAAVAARRAGIPSLWHGFGRMFAEGIGLESPVRVAPGLPHVDICPPSLQDPAFLSTVERLPLRPVPFSPPDPGFPVESAGPLVFVTLGTAFGTAELLDTVLRGLSTVDARVVVAAGRVDPAEVSAAAPNATVHRWVPQAALMPHADVVVHHGGSGTTLGALAAGVPQVLLPQGADQFGNADAVRRVGAGGCPDPAGGPEAVREAVVRLLARTAPERDAARAVRDEIARMPSPAEVAGDLASYATG